MSLNIEGLFPFFILIGVFILKRLGKKMHQKNKEKGGVIPPPDTPRSQPKVNPPPSIRPRSVELSEVLEKEDFYRKKKPRIGKLVSGLKSKKDLILLSEILVNKHHLY